MHFLTHNILSTQLWDDRKHHKLYNQSRDIFDRANINVDIFYTTTGRRPTKADIGQLNSLVLSLQKARTALQTKAELASDLNARAKIDERDYEYITKHERKLAEWLEMVVKVQTKLQKQVDAEMWASDKRESMSSVSSTTYLINKPLPPLSRAACYSGKQHKMSVVVEEKAAEVRTTELARGK